MSFAELGLSPKVLAAVEAAGYTIPTYYDSLLAKLIVLAPTRPEAINRMQRAISEFTIEGVKTTLPLFTRIMQHDVYRRGEAYTDFIQKYMSVPMNGTKA